MKLNIKAFCLTTGILWAVAVFLVGLANGRDMGAHFCSSWPPYTPAMMPPGKE